MPNKLGAAVKSNVVAVFDRIGGREQMAQWAQDNLTEFYRLYARLIPTESTTDITFRQVHELSRDELVAIATGCGDGIDSEIGCEGSPGELH